MNYYSPLLHNKSLAFTRCNDIIIWCKSKILKTPFTQLNHLIRWLVNKLGQLACRCFDGASLICGWLDT